MSVINCFSGMTMGLLGISSILYTKAFNDYRAGHRCKAIAAFALGVLATASAFINTSMTLSSLQEETRSHNFQLTGQCVPGIETLQKTMPFGARTATLLCLPTGETQLASIK